MEDHLKTFLTGVVCLVAVGNRRRGDDAVGPLLMDRLVGKVDAVCIDAGVAPENYLESIVRSAPQSVLFVDAADFHGKPGETRLLRPGELAGGGLSTHAVSLGVVCEYLEGRGLSRVAVLAVQPVSTGLGTPVSLEVQRAVSRLARMLSRVRPVDRGKP